VNALLSVYPDFDWIIWKFNDVSNLNDKRNYRKFFNWVGKQLGFKSYEDWYNALECINKHGVNESLQLYNNSGNALSIDPDFDWIVSKLKISTLGFQGEHDTSLLSVMAKTLKFSHLDEWYRVSIKDLSQAGALGFVKKRGGLPNLLKELYPNHNWQEEKFLSMQKKSSQWWLYKSLHEIFPPGSEILEEFHLPSMSFVQTGYLMTFDIYVPQLKIVFEYHGYHHYHDHYMFGDIRSQNERDKQKRAACICHNINYLEVPYWWQRDKVDQL